MKKIGIIYGSTTGTCSTIAENIAEKLGVASSDVIDVANVSKENFENYDVLLLGSSTWGMGELQDDWYDGVNTLKSADLAGKSVGFFSCGDADSYPDTFCDAMGLIRQEIESAGCTFIGKTSTSGYSFSDSAALVDGDFVGLAIDDINESDKTDSRISEWVELIKKEI